jgi:penicillin-binding protein 1A
MTRAFAAFANGGIVTRPTLIRRVESADGQLLYEAARNDTRAVSTVTAFILTSMLANVVDAGTGWQARQVGFARPAAGKTGTTNDRRDAWFVGYTPYLATGVWIGHDRPHPIATRGSAAELAVPLWGRFMMTATDDDPPDGFAVPDGVEPARICRLSGLLANDACRHAEITDEHANGGGESMVYTEYFATGTAPVNYCPLHRGWSIVDLFVRGGHTVSPRAIPPMSPPFVTDEATAGPLPAGPNVVPRPQERSETQPERRGFWGRLFGIGKGDGSGRTAGPPKKAPVPATPATLLP